VDRPLDKLNALIAMTGKLFSLVADLCGEDNADALSHHEVLLPGTLLSKFVSDKLAECLAIFKRQVCFLPECDSSCHTKPESTSHASSIHVRIVHCCAISYVQHSQRKASLPAACQWSAWPTLRQVRFSPLPILYLKPELKGMSHPAIAVGTCYVQSRAE